MEWFESLKSDFINCFITKNRWTMLTKGLGNTLLITVIALAIGMVIGILIAVVRVAWDANSTRMKKGPMRFLLHAADCICRVYTTVIRGTPSVVQLMIMYYIILASSRNAILVAAISFGLNSGAYVSEIVRGGILSIDKGQTEAGRTLGLNYVQTMFYIIAPQVLKNILPTMCNEFITLIKETSVAGWVGVPELTYGGDRIRGTTYSAFMPLIAVALIYLVVVMILTKLTGMLERRLRKGDRR